MFAPVSIALTRLDYEDRFRLWDVASSGRASTSRGEIVVRPTPNALSDFEVVVGIPQALAAEKAGETHLRVQVTSMPDLEAFTLA